MIRRGLRIDDGSDDEVKEERITLDPNRKRGAFEKDMDNLLFGGLAVKRKEVVKKDQHEQKFQLQSVVKKLESSITTTKQQVSFEFVKTTESFVKKTNSVIVNSNSMTKTVGQLSLNSSQTQKRANSRSKIISPENLFQEAVSMKGSMISKQGEYSLKNSNNIHKVSFEPKVLEERKANEVFREVIQNLCKVQSTRPNYIRKMKHLCDVDSFVEENSKQHRFIDVVRPVECSKNYINKFQSSNFRDKQFPPSQTSLGAQFQQQCNVEWKRFEQTVNHATLGKYIDPNDIKKGKFSSSKFISMLSVLAEREENIKKLIEDQIFNNSQSVYYVRLFVNSVWRYVAVDTFMPMSQGTNGSATSYDDNESDFWVSLIQKAYAKVFNGYSVFKRPQPIKYYLRDLTGASTSIHKIQNNPDIFGIVKKSLENKKVVGAVMKHSVSELGMNPDFTLAVLGINKKGGLTMRYSWPLIQQKAAIPISREGVLDFNDTQLSLHLSHIIIANTSRNYFTTTIQTRHQRHFYVSYKINLKQKTQGWFTLTQMDERMFPKQTYTYQPARLLIQKKIDDKKWDFVAGGFSHMERNLDVEVTLQKGEYYIFVFVNWKQSVYDFWLTFYGSTSVEFVKVPTLNNHNIISLGLQSQNLLSGKRSALGHVHQYISYHQQTNLILITVVNTSSKPYTYTQDLSKINFQSLSLVNLTYNQDDVLEQMTKEQLINYKLQAIQNRKWQIDLKSQEVFTWVISTSENYDPGNYKAWGFR